MTHGPFPNVDWLLWSLIFVFGAAMLAAVVRILRVEAGTVEQLALTSIPDPRPNGAREIHLSEQEREVLRFVAEG